MLTARKLPWAELDREEKILQTHEFGGIGSNEDKWYGGNVHFTAKLIVAKDKKDVFRLVLDRPTLGSSNRFMRRFGSERFIRVRIQKDALMQKGDKLTEYFRRPFIICGKVYRAFFAKEQNVFLFRTNEVVSGHSERLSVAPPADPSTTREWSFLRFIKWHNDLQLNDDQVATHRCGTVLICSPVCLSDHV